MKQLEEQYRLSRLLALVILFAVTGFTFKPYAVGRPFPDALAGQLALRQDLLLLPVFVLAALLWPKRTGSLHPGSRGPSGLVVALTALFLLVVCRIGNDLVFQGLELSRDEQMAIFDEYIFSRGRLYWPIAEGWRDMADALNRRFMLPVPGNEFWVSAYLPVHAAFRALVGLGGDADLASPLMAALSSVSLWMVARKLWPDSGKTVLLSLGLLVTSSQVVITAMNPFSMTMHLGLNLLWLALFLQGRWPTHVLAVLIAFFATGIHQPLFHPLFALPFLLLLAYQKSWKVFAFYIVSYAAISLFWIAWPLWITSQASSSALQVACVGLDCSSKAGFAERLLATLGPITRTNVWLMAANLLRFVCWQNPILVPLALFGVIGCWRSEPLVLALAAGLLLPVAFMFAVLPLQGHGWGYRYLHPVLGNAILLACYGYHRMLKAGLSLDRPVALASAFGLLLLPVHAWMAASFIQPFAKINAEVTSISADVVIVDTNQVPFDQGFVFNLPDLSNRPRLLIGPVVTPEMLPRLCRSASIAFYEAPRMRAMADLFETTVPTQPSKHIRELESAARQLGCQVVPPSSASGTSK